jgi:hypothetical protein
MNTSSTTVGLSVHDIFRILTLRQPVAPQWQRDLENQGLVHINCYLCAKDLDWAQPEFLRVHAQPLCSTCQIGVDEELRKQERAAKRLEEKRALAVMTGQSTAQELARLASNPAEIPTQAPAPTIELPEGESA